MTIKITDILFKRGVEAKRSTVTFKEGEPFYSKDKKELYIGDGATPGGIPVGTVKTDGASLADSIALFKDTTGKLLYGITKSDLFKGYATEQFVAGAITGSVPSVKVNNAKLADKATDSYALKGRDDYLTPDVITQGYTENDPAKIVSASAIKKLFDTLKGLIDGLTNTKLNKTDVTSDLTSTNTAKAASAAAIKTVNDKIAPISTKADKAITDSAKAIRDAATAKASGDTAQTLANDAKVAAANNKAHLDKLPGNVTKGTANPTGGADGDIYLQYK